ncbi:MAG: ferritin-like domain-containing protein [Acidimicrobiales bacterium]
MTNETAATEEDRSMSTNEDMLGRAEVNDLQAILSITSTDVGELVHAVKDNADALFTWNYEKGERPALNKLYEKAKGAQWNGETDLPWETPVDVEKVVANAPRDNLTDPVFLAAQRPGEPLASWSEKDWTTLRIESQNWTMSQFMHGEQGALLCTAKIVETVPWIDAKYYAATQVMDEARHVEVFAKYLDTKMNGHYPLNAHLGMLLDDVIADSRWDMTYLGMQIMVEGLALAAFGFMHQLTEEPLLKKLLRYVMSDEARHVAFGVLSLKEYYGELSDAEMLERQQFAFEAAVRMRDRFLQQEVWERMGVDVRRMMQLQLEYAGDKNEDVFQQLLFSKIVPNCKKLGLLDRNAGWLRSKFAEMGVIQFEDWADTGEEYDTMSLEAVAAERA